MSHSLGRRKLLLSALLLTVSLGAGSRAQADTYSYASSNFHIDHLANDGTQPGGFDMLDLTGTPGAVTLAPNVPQLANIGNLTFTVGVSSTNPFDTTTTETWGFTFAGHAVTLTEDVTVQSRAADNLFLMHGQTTTVDVGGGKFVQIIPQDFKLTDQGIGAHTGTLQAQFTEIPEASTMLGFGGLLSAGGLGMLRSRRVRKAN